MGWDSQGYKRNYDYSISPPKYLYSKWETGNNVCENPEINKYDGIDVDFDDRNYKVEILYGPSSTPFFRGYLFGLNDTPKEPKRILKKFDKLPVYKTKHGQEVKLFKIDRLIFVELPGILLFYEILKEWSTDEWYELKRDFHYFTNSDQLPELKNAIEQLAPKYW